ncbi:MAG: pyridoxal phosphate-dependent aminotransferase [Proteobacteria bacterium]|nr:MAG: pyridoxal phosphate-dependent aminotransferase [Pseudomonadota bacterium]
MPRPPKTVPAIAAMPGAVYSPLGDRIRLRQGPVYPLHVGDTWRDPFDGGRMQDLAQAAHPGIHRYTATQGIPALVDAIVEKVRARNRIACERDGVLVTGGATAGLAHAVGALVEPGDEVLILAPFWPLIRGIAQSWRATPVEVPFFDRVSCADDALAAVEARRSERTVALYVSTPSNPSGRVLPAAWLERFAEWARRHDLWLLSDEVYEEVIHRGEHVSLARFAPERTITSFSFSKTYGMAGYRCGYLVGPPAVIAEAHKLHTHCTYSAPTPAQYAALAALRGGDAWLAETRACYRAAGDDAARVLGVPEPEGSTFLFLDVRSRLDARGMNGFLEDVFEDGVVLSPGASSGRDYEGFARLCYTAAPPEQVATAVRLLAARLGRSPVGRPPLSHPGGAR